MFKYLFDHIFIGVYLGDQRECSYLGFLRFKVQWVGRLLSGKIAKIAIYDKGRVNGKTTYRHWVSKLKVIKYNHHMTKI